METKSLCNGKYTLIKLATLEPERLERLTAIVSEKVRENVEIATIAINNIRKTTEICYSYTNDWDEEYIANITIKNEELKAKVEELKREQTKDQEPEIGYNCTGSYSNLSDPIRNLDKIQASRKYVYQDFPTVQKQPIEIINNTKDDTTLIDWRVERLKAHFKQDGIIKTITMSKENNKNVYKLEFDTNRFYGQEKYCFFSDEQLAESSPIERKKESIISYDKQKLENLKTEVAKFNEISDKINIPLNERREFFKNNPEIHQKVLSELKRWIASVDQARSTK